MHKLGDDELVLAYRDGERAAAELLVRRYSNRLHRYLYRLAGANSAADLVQETFLAFFRTVDNYEPRGQLSSYLFRIATSKARDLARRGGREFLAPEIHVLPDGKSDPAYLVAQAQEQAATKSQVREAIEELAPQQREVLLLAEYEGLDYQSIARSVGCTLGAVKQRLFRARISLKKKIERLWGKGEEADHAL